MANQPLPLPSPPPTPSTPVSDAKGTATANAISAQLDALLITYLDLLDSYTTLREQLSKGLSNGFFSLAQAQRSTTLGTGRRYGEECYDDRMKAGRRVNIDTQPKQRSSTNSPKEEEEKRSPSVSDLDNQVPEGQDLESSTDSEPQAHFYIVENTPATPLVSRQLDTTPSHPQVLEETHPTPQANTDLPTDPSTPTPVASTSPTSLPKHHSKDPLKWFGILTPPSLRQSQSHFICALAGPIPDLINTRFQLEKLEEQIRRTKAGLEDRSEPNKQVIGDHTVRAMPSDDPLSPRQVSTANTTNSTRSNPSTKKSLASRTAGPRSRILKID